MTTVTTPQADLVTPDAVESVPAGPSAAKGHSYLRRLVARPGVWFSAGWVLLVLVCSFGASILAPHDPLAQDLGNSFALPSGEYLLGTDSLGRDILSRLMHGGSISILGSATTVVTALVIGVPLGLIAGYRAGWLDAVISRLAELLMALPTIIILLAVVAVYGREFTISMTAFGIIVSASFIRLVRATTAAVRNELYVDAAKVSGLGGFRIVVRHVLPNVTAPLLILSSVTLGTALLVQSGLGFLGLGPQQPAPNWGAGIAEAALNINVDPWLMVPTGMVLILTVLSFNFLGDALRDAAPTTKGNAATGKPFARLRLPGAARSSDVTTSATGSAPLLDVRDLVVSFPVEGGMQPVVDGVSFDVRKGETIGLVGESGCGKTVTALSIPGLTPGEGHIVSGQVLFDGVDLARVSDKELSGYRGTRIGYIAQEPMVSLDPAFTIGYQLCEPIRYHAKMNRTQARERALELLGLVGIPNPENVFRSYPHQLSGGMAQRAGIAIALSGEPELLIADEPTTALDVTVQAEILDLLRSLQERLGMALILVTHDLGVVADICDRAVVMYAGQVVEQAPVEELFEQPRHPYTRGLLRSTPALEGTEGTLPTIEGTVPVPRDWPHGCRFASRCALVVPECTTQPVPLVALDAFGRQSRCIRIDSLEEVEHEYSSRAV
ncbi:dipeptide/oligopeptide/nickel ABC transporter permease/ATP-binding protein [Rhodococcus sp. KBS0724]|uniref:dipeptide/oligopeptide/nickel ABC transporter permease/ATP-binding protein n=1 Tax=Rhodococcus sp. KBS0724 TaxID=1179674 RepID=UPI00110DBA31|nr:dipeptide/oligopeptide/nickel ABC transporter permease/ATP-binding protein [Rhodococcus sp. KBS0724]TSD49410.1 dipeptide/oligopeptide/nickel ABC transporter permease/ATP-binding protein [Rhodococcus sp. KBS0724]